jgi:hypothetical protein
MAKYLLLLKQQKYFVEQFVLQNYHWKKMLPTTYPKKKPLAQVIARVFVVVNTPNLVHNSRRKSCCLF